MPKAVPKTFSRSFSVFLLLSCLIMPASFADIIELSKEQTKQRPLSISVSGFDNASTFRLTAKIEQRLHGTCRLIHGTFPDDLYERLDIVKEPDYEKPGRFMISTYFCEPIFHGSDGVFPLDVYYMINGWNDQTKNLAARTSFERLALSKVEKFKREHKWSEDEDWLPNKVTSDLSPGNRELLQWLQKKSQCKFQVIRTDKATKHNLTSLLCGRLKYPQANKQAVAIKFLTSFGKLFGLATVNALQTDRPLIDGTKVYFTQRYKDLPVFNAGIAVWIDSQSYVYMVGSHLIPVDQLADLLLTPKITALSAKGIAVKDRPKVDEKQLPVLHKGMAKKILSVSSDPQLGIIVFDTPKLAYRFLYNHIYYFIDALDGEIIQRLPQPEARPVLWSNRKVFSKTLTGLPASSTRVAMVSSLVAKHLPISS